MRVVVALDEDPAHVGGLPLLDEPAEHDPRVLPLRLGLLPLDLGRHLRIEVSRVRVEARHLARRLLEGALVEDRIAPFGAPDPEALEEPARARLVVLPEFLGHELAVAVDRELADEVLRPLEDIDLEPGLPVRRIHDEGVAEDLEVEVAVRGVELGEARPEVLLELDGLVGAGLEPEEPLRAARDGALELPVREGLVPVEGDLGDRDPLPLLDADHEIRAPGAPGDRRHLLGDLDVGDPLLGELGADVLPRLGEELGRVGDSGLEADLLPDAALAHEPEPLDPPLPDDRVLLDVEGERDEPVGRLLGRDGDVGEAPRRPEALLGVLDLAEGDRVPAEDPDRADERGRLHEDVAGDGHRVDPDGAGRLRTEPAGPRRDGRGGEGGKQASVHGDGNGAAGSRHPATPS